MPLESKHHDLVLSFIRVDDMFEWAMLLLLHKNPPKARPSILFGQLLLSHARDSFVSYPVMSSYTIQFLYRVQDQYYLGMIYGFRTNHSNSHRHLAFCTTIDHSLLDSRRSGSILTKERNKIPLRMASEMPQMSPSEIRQKAPFDHHQSVSK